MKTSTFLLAIAPLLFLLATIQIAGLKSTDEVSNAISTMELSKDCTNWISFSDNKLKRQLALQASTSNLEFLKMEVAGDEQIHVLASNSSNNFLSFIKGEANVSWHPKLTAKVQQIIVEISKDQLAITPVSASASYLKGDFSPILILAALEMEFSNGAPYLILGKRNDELSVVFFTGRSDTNQFLSCRIGDGCVLSKNDRSGGPAEVKSTASQAVVEQSITLVRQTCDAIASANISGILKSYQASIQRCSQLGPVSDSLKHLASWKEQCEEVQRGLIELIEAKM